MSTDSDETYADGNGATELSESERHRLLSNDRRRRTLDVLADRPTPIDLDELAMEVAGRESESCELDDDAIERVTISLHHNHVPTMAELGVVDYDADSSRVVRRNDVFETRR